MNKFAVMGCIIAVITISVVVFYNFNSDTVSTSNVQATSKLIDGFTVPVTIISASDSSSWTPNIAMDKNNSMMYVTYVETNDKISNVYIKKSDDGGKTFSNPVKVNDQPDVFLDGRVPPQIKIGPNGEVYVLWIKGEPAPRLFMQVLRGISFAVSTDGAKTFSSAITIAQNESPADRSFTALDVSSDGKIYVGWLQSPAMKLGNGTIVSDNSIAPTVNFARSLDGGHSFEPSIAIDKNQCECCNVFLTSDAHGNVYISWRKKFDVPSGAPPPTREGMSDMPGMSGQLTVRDIVVAHSADGGKSFTKPIKIHDDNFEWNTCLHVGAPMAVDSKGILHVAWYTGKEGMAGIHYATSSDYGQTFSEPTSLFTGDWVPPSRIALIVDNNDNTWITWEDTTGLSANSVHWKYEDTKAKIELAVITPDGQVIKRTNPINQVDGKSPVIANDKDTILIVWGSTDNGVQSSMLNNIPS